MFQPGDRVRCVIAAEGTNLKQGVYTVARSTDQFLFLREIIGGWQTFRFIPASTMFTLDELMD